MKNLPHNDFTIGFPDEWRDSSAVLMIAPPNKGFTPNITITRDYLEFKMNAKEFAINQLEQLRTELAENNYNVVEEAPFALTGADAYKRIHQFHADEETIITQMQVYITKGTIAIIVTCTNLAEYFERTKPIFLEAIKQFKWIGQEKQTNTDQDDNSIV